MVFNSIRSAFRTLGDESASTGEKITAAMMAISMGVPAAFGAIKNLTTVY
jgi:hypothetical protein